ncbi:WcaF family extracellular polysaccharide biosynthesis acetyltransferase [Bacteroidales bacterium]|nr:WcaF family extracellular polysaccharide biosynthesis acetyltransferase [Bacteroidales bacterium]
MNTVDLSKFESDIYISGGKNKIKKLLWFFTSAIIFQSPLFPIVKLKIFLLRLFGAKIGKGVNIKPLVYIKFPWRLNIGDHVWIGEKVWIANEGTLTIGNNVCISHEVLLMSGGHNFKKKYFDVYANPINIEDGVWLGAQSAVGGGITLKSHAVLAMKSVANSDLEAFKIYRGNPAVPVKNRIIE